MTSTYSSKLRLNLMGNGDQSGTWGQTTNINLGTLLEQSIAGIAEVNINGLTSYTLTEYDGVSDESRAAVILLSGTLAASCNVICPSGAGFSKIYFVQNSTTGGFSIVLKTAAGSGITVPAGGRAVVYCDGTNVLSAVNELPASSTVGGLPVATTTGTQTLTNKTLTAPKFADLGFIADANGNKMVVFDTIVSAVNEITLANAITGNGPILAATGDDINIDLNLVAKGTGLVKANGVAVVSVSGAQTLTGKTLTNAIVDGSGNDPALLITQTGEGNAIRVEDSTSPDSTPTVIDKDGNVYIGSEGSVGVGGGTGRLQISSAGSNQAWLTRYSNNSSGSGLVFGKSRGATVGSDVPVQTGDDLGFVEFRGYNGSNYVSAAYIQADVDAGTISGTSLPGVLSFFTTPDGTTISTEKVRISNVGAVGIGGANYGTSGQVLTSGGASAAPSWAAPVSITLGTAVAASGSEVGFTGIPSSAKKITLSFANLSCSGTAQTQIGTSAGFITTGYSSRSSTDGGTSSSTTGFIFREDGPGGAITLTKISDTIWAATHSAGGSSGGGSVVYSGTLDRVRLTGGSFSGTVNIMYE